MPRYDFVCNACQQAFELTLSMREKAALTPVCPACGSGDVTRQYAGVGVCGVRGGGSACQSGSCSSCSGCG